MQGGRRLEDKWSLCNLLAIGGLVIKCCSGHVELTSSWIIGHWTPGKKMKCIIQTLPFPLHVFSFFNIFFFFFGMKQHNIDSTGPLKQSSLSCLEVELRQTVHTWLETILIASTRRQGYWEKGTTKTKTSNSISVRRYHRTQRGTMRWGGTMRQ